MTVVSRGQGPNHGVTGEQVLVAAETYAQEAGWLDLSEGEVRAKCVLHNGGLGEAEEPLLTVFCQNPSEADTEELAAFWAFWQSTADQLVLHQSSRNVIGVPDDVDRRTDSSFLHHQESGTDVGWAGTVLEHRAEFVGLSEHVQQLTRVLLSVDDEIESV